jgi:hypothetical protein
MIMKKLYSQIWAQKIQGLLTETASILQVFAAILLRRAALGAVGAVLLCFVVLCLVGGIWGAAVRAAPCYAGREPSRIEGAMFGSFSVLFLYGWWVVPLGATVGAILGQACGLWMGPRLSRTGRDSG